MNIKIVCMLSHFSHVRVLVTLWTIAHQAPLSEGFSRQDYWSELPCSPPGDLPDPGTELTSLMSHALEEEIFFFLSLVPHGKNRILRLGGKYKIHIFTYAEYKVLHVELYSELSEKPKWTNTTDYVVLSFHEENPCQFFERSKVFFWQRILKQMSPVCIIYYVSWSRWCRQRLC